AIAYGAQCEPVIRKELVLLDLRAKRSGLSVLVLLERFQRGADLFGGRGGRGPLDPALKRIDRQRAHQIDVDPVSWPEGCLGRCRGRRQFRRFGFRRGRGSFGGRAFGSGWLACSRGGALFSCLRCLSGGALGSCLRGLSGGALGS